MNPYHRTPKKIVKLQKEIQNFIQNYENSESKPKKNMSNSLKTTFFVHCASFDYKGVLSLIERRYKMWLVSRWLKKAKKRKVLLKKGLSIRVRFFFDSELPYETRTSLSIALHSTFTNSKFILFIEIWINVFVKKILVWRKLY